ncbi:MAG: DNA-binding protein WhiA [Ruminococcaceae bacterium]|nr:DNA-binding protein WhiA [Oscillospiraceae bacterium]
MSYCTNIKDELLILPAKGTCCRRSLLYGILYGSRLPASKGEGLFLTYPIPAGSQQDHAAFISELFENQYRMRPEILPETRGAHRYLNIRYHHKQILRTLASLSEATEANQSQLHELLGFRCPECASKFMRGIFLSSGTVNDPQKSYHLEIKSPADGRADLLCSLFMNIDSMPGSTRRSGDVGFIWKSGAAVVELLNYMGATMGVFDILNTQVEREIKNNENRATNCDTRNIQRSISAAAKYINAVTYLEENHLLDSLPDDLQATAKLRIGHPEVSLRELAELHNPTITKSGLNHRLEKIMAIYENIKSES